jgi:hypothetical protein
MTQNEIMQMAKQAGFEGCVELTWEDVICTEELVAFAKLVAQHEREACAKVADNFAMTSQYKTQRSLAEWCASSIRARVQA